MADSSRRGFQGAGLFSKHTSSVFTFAKPLSILLLASGLLACGGGGGGGSSSGSIAACSGADFTATQYEAGDSAELITKKSLSQIYLMQGSDALPLESTPSDMGYFITVPMTPDLAANGGTVSYEAELDGKRCALPSLDVTPLPQADDDAYADALDALEKALTNIESALAFDPDTATSDDISKDPFQFLAYWLHEIFYDPKSEISLPYQRNLLASLSATDIQFFSQMVEKLDLIQTLDDLATEFEQPIFGINSPQAASIRSTRNQPTVYRAETCTHYLNDPRDYKVSLTDAGSLSIAMNMAYEAQRKAKNAQANAAAKAAQNTALNSVMAVASEVKGGALGLPLAVLGTIAGSASLRANLLDDMTANMLPSKIVHTNIEVIPRASLEEDFSDGQTNPKWIFSVNAESETFEIGKQIAAMVQTILGAPGSPMDGKALTGYNEVANRALSDAKVSDCALTVPPLLWSNIRIPGNFAEGSVTGDAFAIDSEPDTLKPLAIGQAELAVQMKSGLFPSYSNTLADQRGTKAIENRKKSFVFSSDPIVVKNPGESKNIDVLISNSSFPEKHSLFYSGALQVNESLSGNILSLAIDTPSDPDLYPLDITIQSTSHSLAPVNARSKTVQVVLQGLEIEIEEIQSGFCDSGSYIEENNARITGAKSDDTVTWTASGGKITTLADNHMRFEAQQPGDYTLTATSNEDPTISQSFVIQASDCSTNMYMYGKVITNVESPDVSGSCPVNNPDDTEEITTYGVEVDSYNNINPGNIRSKMSTFGPSQAINFDQSDSGTYLHSYDANEVCHTKQIDLIASSSGQVRSVGDGRVNFNTEHTTKGECYASQESDGSNTTLCTLASAGETYQIIWMFDHKQARSYNVVNALSCTAPPVNYPQGIPTSPDMVYQLLMYDENNQFVDPSLITTQPAFSTNCRAGSPPGGHSFDLPEMPEGYHVMILLSMAYPVGKLPDLSGGNNPGATSLPASGKITGYIQVKPQ
ncbi:hypothetical protein [Spongiibacter tropicus]|uniref:hypothetical protein n=1 Tax=Spongiibacter tropicus TaxID=454602 RepID=UPI0003B5D5D4|nr:hypothetical protein [Spongiibacter tropicus]